MTAMGEASVEILLDIIEDAAFIAMSLCRLRCARCVRGSSLIRFFPREPREINLKRSIDEMKKVSLQ